MIWRTSMSALKFQCYMHVKMFFSFSGNILIVTRICNHFLFVEWNHKIAFKWYLQFTISCCYDMKILRNNFSDRFFHSSLMCSSTLKVHTATNLKAKRILNRKQFNLKRQTLSSGVNSRSDATVSWRWKGSNFYGSHLN